MQVKNPCLNLASRFGIAAEEVPTKGAMQMQQKKPKRLTNGLWNVERNYLSALHT